MMRKLGRFVIWTSHAETASAESGIRSNLPTRGHQALTASLVRITLFGPSCLPSAAVGRFSTQAFMSASRYRTMLLTFTYCGPSPCSLQRRRQARLILRQAETSISVNRDSRCTSHL